MNNIKQGDIVSRKSYKKDILFIVKKIVVTKRGKIAILKGIIDRIQADSPVEDLEIVEKKIADKEIEKLNNKINENITKINRKKSDNEYRIGILNPNNRSKEKIVTGKILHLDGDKKYSEKSYRYYRKLGLNAIVKNIPEYRQSKVVYNLLEIYNPDILVITGHDRND